MAAAFLTVGGMNTGLVDAKASESAGILWAPMGFPCSGTVGSSVTAAGWLGVVALCWAANKSCIWAWRLAICSSMEALVILFGVAAFLVAGVFGVNSCSS